MKAPDRAILIAGFIVATAAGIVAPLMSTPEIIPGVVLALGLAALSFVRPNVGLVALIVASMMNRFHLLTPFGNARVDQLVLLIVAAGVLLRVTLDSSRHQGRMSRTNDRFTLLILGLLFAYIAVNALSSIQYSPDIRESMNVVLWLTLSLFSMILTLSVAAHYMSPVLVLKSVVFAGVFAGFVAIVLFFLDRLDVTTYGMNHFMYWQDGRWISRSTLQGTFYESNILGSFQAFIFVLLFGSYDNGSRTSWLGTRSQHRLLITISLVTLILSLSRAAWLGAVLGVAVWYVARLRRRTLPLIAVSFSGLGLSIMAVALGLFLPGRTDSPPSDSLFSDSTGTISWRLETFESALRLAMDSPWLGHGTNSYIQRYFNPEDDTGYLSGLFIATLYDSGVIGTLPLLLCFAFVLVSLWKAGAHRAMSQSGQLALALLGACLALLVSYQSTNAFWFSYNWIILAAVCKIPSIIRGNEALSAEIAKYSGVMGAQYRETTSLRPVSDRHSKRLMARNTA